MSEAPGRIWAGPSLDDKGVFWDVGHWDAAYDDGCVEYRRDDLPATDEQALANPKVQALVDALECMMACVDECDVVDAYNRAEAALAAAKETT